MLTPFFCEQRREFHKVVKGPGGEDHAEYLRRCTAFSISPCNAPRTADLYRGTSPIRNCPPPPHKVKGGEIAIAQEVISVQTTPDCWRG